MANTSVLIFVSLVTIALSSACDVQCKNLINDFVCQALGCRNKYMLLCRQTCTDCTPCPEVIAQTCQGCRDLYVGCANLDEASCNRQTSLGPLRNFCRATCKVCTPCEAIPAPTEEVVEEVEEVTMTTEIPTVTPCVSAEECYDRNKPSICEQNKAFCNLPQYHLFTGLCRNTCQVCTVCDLPPDNSMHLCNDCQDLRHECLDWLSRGYCEVNSLYPKVRTVCPKSCELCQPVECNYPGPK